MSLQPACSHCGTGLPVPSTYTPALDQERLGRQYALVLAAMLDGKWRTLAEISQATKGEPEASCSARIREMRRRLRATHIVARRRRPGIDPRRGVWEYQLLALSSLAEVA